MKRSGAHCTNTPFHIQRFTASTCTAEAGNTYVCERGFQSIANQTCLLPYGCNEGSCCESRTVGAGPSTNYDNTVCVHLYVFQ